MISAARLSMLAAFFIASIALAAPSDPPRKNDRSRPADGALKVGQEAPDFDLVLLKDDDPKETKKKTSDASAKEKQKQDDAPARVKLSALRGSKPVLLIFGSYT